MLLYGLGLTKEILKLTGIGISEEIATDLATLVHTNRETLESAAANASVGIPTLDDMKWRVDVSMSTSDLSKCLKPSILMQMRLSDGSLQNFQLPLEKFHELRCNVAKALKSIHELEAHPLIRVIEHVEQNEKQAFSQRIIVIFPQRCDMIYHTRIVSHSLTSNVYAFGLVRLLRTKMWRMQYNINTPKIYFMLLPLQSRFCTITKFSCTHSHVLLLTLKVWKMKPLKVYFLGTLKF